MAVATVNTSDGRILKLGRIKPKARPQTLSFSSYFDPAQMTVPPPASLDYHTKAVASMRRMYGNDREGCCVISSAMHQFGLWSGNDSDSGGLVLATDKEVHDQYQSICGPGDNGCMIDAVLNYTKTRGLIAGGKVYKIDGYVNVDWRDKLQVQVALYLFGSLKLGVNLPQAWADSPDGGKWDVTNSRIVGGHDIPCVGYDPKGVVISTWGGLRTITWAAFTSTKWLEECYCVLAPLWYGNDNLSPSGVNVSKLKSDLTMLGGGTTPPIDPDPQPPPPPPVGVIAAVDAAFTELFPQLPPGSQLNADVLMTHGYIIAWLTSHGYK